MKKLLVTGDMDTTQLAELNCFVCHIKEPESEKQIIDELHDTSYYIIGGPEYCSKDFLDVAKKLELVVVLGTGTSSFIDLDVAEDKGIKVMNTPKLNASTVAQFAFSVMMVRNARFHLSWQKMQSAEWFQTPYKELASLKVGLVGLGNINQELLSIIRKFSSQPVYYYATAPKFALHDKHQLIYAPLPHLFNECDLVIISVTFNKSTIALIDSDVLSNANKELDLLCFSSPHVICPTALKNALLSKTIRSAYMDGYYQEWLDVPGIEHDKYGLLSLDPSVFMATTHIAAQSKEAISALVTEAVNKVKQFERNLCGRS